MEYNMSNETAENKTILNNSVNSSCITEDLMDFKKVFLPTLYSLVFALGLLGNGLVVCVLLWFRHKCNLTNICLLNLALSNLLFVLSLPFYAKNAAISNWPWDVHMCRLVECLYSLGFYASIGFMVIMTLDRYLLIVHSQSVTMWHTYPLRMVLIALVWILSLAVSLPNIIYAGISTDKETIYCGVQFSPKMAMFDFIKINILSLVLPLSIMVFCYSRIIPIVMNMKTQRKHKAIKLIFIILIAFFLFCTPYNVLLFLYMLKEYGHFQDCQQKNRLRIAMMWTECIAYSHCCLNPIIYAFAGEKFCRLVVKMIGQCLPHRGRSRSIPGSESSEFAL